MTARQTKPAPTTARPSIAGPSLARPSLARPSLARFAAGLTAGLGLAAAPLAAAQEGEGAGDVTYAENGAMGMLPAASRLAEDVHFFHYGVLMPIIVGIVILVLALLVWTILRYNARANAEPQRFSHNTTLEVVWTAGPILVLLAIALFSFDLLYQEDVIPDGRQTVAEADGVRREFAFENDFPSERRRVVRPDQIQVLIDDGAGPVRLSPRDYKLDGLGDDLVVAVLDEAPPAGAAVILRGGRSLVGRGARRTIAMAPTMTLKVNGYQWGWSYSYPDFGDFEYASNMLPADKTSERLYRLAVDNEVVVPVGETIRVTTTARDVIHSWAMPNFAIKIDAVPGRINETWFSADAPGLYYGQCSEICGVRHAFMPIAVRAVPRPEFEAWVDEQREFAGLEPMFGGEARLAAVAE